jgi:hypothetical protein
LFVVADIPCRVVRLLHYYAFCLAAPLNLLCLSVGTAWLPGLSASPYMTTTLLLLLLLLLL